ncbi:L-asparaginase-like [Engraulis encrasicolus]|uniref:L-asparaginase-like n=1 Tax=Engraulis encrasicolus TaxID=184585 RepID=UPI002FD042E6
MQNDPLVSVTNVEVLGPKTRNRDFLKCVGDLIGSRLGKTKRNKETDFGNKAYAYFACKCVANNDFVSLQELLKVVDIDTSDYNGQTPIHRACEMGNIGMMKYLITKGCSYNLADVQGNTPMTLAIMNNDVIMVRTLQMLGGAVYLESVRIGMELCKATQARDYRKLQAWFFAGVDMDQGDYNGRTAMHTAVRNRDAMTVSRLLEYGATPLEEDTWGWTALAEAKKHHLTDILMLFHPLFTEKFTTKHLYQLYKSGMDDALE